MSEHEFCPYFQHAVELVGRRWCGAIAQALLDGPRHFSQIERAIPGISARALTQRLKELEAEGVVVRRVETAAPIRVSYALTDKGRDLERVVAELERWAHDWLAPAEEPTHAGAPLASARRRAAAKRRRSDA